MHCFLLHINNMVILKIAIICRALKDFVLLPCFIQLYVVYMHILYSVLFIIVNILVLSCPTKLSGIL